MFGTSKFLRINLCLWIFISIQLVIALKKDDSIISKTSSIVSEQFKNSSVSLIQIDQIIKQFYSYENIEIILANINELNSFDDYIQANKLVFSEMSKENHLNAPKVIIFYQYLRNSKFNRQNRTQNCQILRQIEELLEENLNQVVKEFANQLRHSQFEIYIDEISKYTQRSFEIVLNMLFEKMLDENFANFKLLAKFSSEFKNKQNQMKALEITFKKVSEKRSIDNSVVAYIFYYFMISSKNGLITMDDIRNEFNSYFNSLETQYHDDAFSFNERHGKREKRGGGGGMKSCTVPSTPG